MFKKILNYIDNMNFKCFICYIISSILTFIYIFYQRKYNIKFPDTILMMSSLVFAHYFFVMSLENSKGKH